MGLRFVEYRRRQWVLRYRDPWSGKQRIKSFSTEGEARQFEAVQAEMHIRERELMRRAKRRMSSASATKATVAELLERYAGTLENPTTRSTTTQHAEPLTAIFGHRRAHCVTCDDVLAWCEVQRQRGVGQSTVHRRVSILRAAYGWAVRARLLLSNPLVSLRIAKPKAQRIAPPSVKEARLLYDAAAPHIQRVIVLGMATGARIGPSELFRLRWSDVDVGTGVIRTCRSGTTCLACSGGGTRRTGRPGAPMSLPIKGAPSGAFPAAGTTPCAGRASRGASGRMTCGTPSPRWRLCTGRTSNVWRRLWGTRTSRFS